MDFVEKYQRQLLDQARFLYPQFPLSDATVQAFYAAPRHLFVKRYREGGSRTWHDVKADNLLEHLNALYSDRPLTLVGEEDQDRTLSTISQPSFVLRMLDMLQLQSGHNVFELGAGSGWNAALMSRLVGTDGHVYSLELLPELAAATQKTITDLDFRNVTIIGGEGGDAYSPGAPYDRAVFTAGSYDIPQPFYQQIKEQGLLLIGIKTQGGGDNLFLLRKVGDHFESIDSMPCGWIQLRGKYQIGDLVATEVEALPIWSELGDKVVGQMPFWWGGTSSYDVFGWRTLPIRSFLAITEPLFCAFEEGREGFRKEQYFGLLDPEERSLVLARGDRLTAYGNRSALDRLLYRVREWAELGMPSGACFHLQVYPASTVLSLRKGQWLVKRPQSQFLWSLD